MQFRIEPGLPDSDRDSDEESLFARWLETG
jgi:hypothetical protein